MSVFPRTNISIGKTYEYEYISEICQMLNKKQGVIESVV